MEALSAEPPGAVDEEESAADADLDAGPQDTDGEPRSLRLRELGLVLLVLFADKLVAALHAWSGLASPGPSPSFDTTPTVLALWRISGSLAVLCVLIYVLFNQGSSLRQLGVTAKWSDLPLGLAAAVLEYLPYPVYYFATFGGQGTWSWLSSAPTPKALSLILLVSLLTSALKCGLVFFAYVITEVQELSGSAVLAVVTSVLLLALYLPGRTLTTVLLQGSTQLIFALFYWKTRRATPLILGQVFFGLTAILFPASFGR